MSIFDGKCPKFHKIRLLVKNIKKWFWVENAESFKKSIFGQKHRKSPFLIENIEKCPKSRFLVKNIEEIDFWSIMSKKFLKSRFWSKISKKSIYGQKCRKTFKKSILVKNIQKMIFGRKCQKKNQKSWFLVKNIEKFGFVTLPPRSRKTGIATWHRFEIAPPHMDTSIAKLAPNFQGTKNNQK